MRNIFIISASAREERDGACLIPGRIGPLGDHSLPGAVRDASITKVSIVDCSAHYYVLYGKECLRVYGK